MKRILASLAVLALLADAGPALADTYGAIAYSPSSGTTGCSHAYGNRGAAETVARRNCDDSANDCRIVIWFRYGCGVAAVGYRGGWGSAGVTTAAKPSAKRSAAAAGRPAAAASSAGSARAENKPTWPENDRGHRSAHRGG